MACFRNKRKETKHGAARGRLIQIRAERWEIRLGKEATPVGPADHITGKTLDLIPSVRESADRFGTEAQRSLVYV